MIDLDDLNRSHKKKKKDRDRDKDGKCLIASMNSFRQEHAFILGKKEKSAENREKKKSSKKCKSRDRDREMKKPKEGDEKGKETIPEQSSTSAKQEVNTNLPSSTTEVNHSVNKTEIKKEVILSLSETVILSENQLPSVKEEITIITPVVKEEPLPLKVETPRIEDEPSAKKIKIEVKKPEKTREDVARILNFSGALNDSIQPPPPCDLKSIESSTTSSLSSTTNSTPSSSRKNSDEVKRSSDELKKKISSSSDKRGDSRTSSSDSHRSKSHKSSSSHHKSTSHSHSSSNSYKHSSSSSSRDCSKCYKLSKIRNKSVGVQCQDHKLVTEPTKVPIINRNQNCQPGLEHLKYGRFFRVETHSNGGASVIHLYQDEIDKLTAEEMDEMVEEFFSLCFAEDENGYALHVMGIVHDAAAYLPDMLEHMADNYSTLTVKAGVLGKNSDIETCTVSQYNEQVSFPNYLYFFFVLQKFIIE